MELALEYSATHTLFTIGSSREEQLAALASEIKELRRVLPSGDKNLIAEKLADLEIRIPCIRIKCSSKEKFIIRNNGKFDFKLSSMAVLNVIALNILNKRDYNCELALKFMLQHFCHVLFNIYQDYNITIEETQDLKDKKVRIKRDKYLY